MKIFKKWLLLFFLVSCVFISDVNAKKNINYEWGFYFEGGYENHVYDLLKVDEYYYVIGSSYSNRYDGDFFAIFDLDGNEVDVACFKNLDGWYYDGVIFEDKIFMFRSQRNEETHNYEDFIDVYNIDLKLLNTINVTDYQNFSFDNYFKDETDEYYFFENYIVNKESNEIVYISDLYVGNEYEDDIKDALANDDYDSYIKYLLLFLEEEFSGTSFLSFSKFLLYRPDVISYDNDLTLANKDYVGWIHLNDDNDSYVLEIYDIDGNTVFRDEISSRYFPRFSLSAGSFYYTDYVIDSYEETDYIGEITEVEAHYILKEYDYDGNLIDSFDLSKVLSGYNYIDSGGINMSGRTLDRLILSDDGMLITTYYTTPDANPSIDKDDVIEGNYATLQKYYFSYPVEVKTDGNGTVEIVEESKVGSNVVFKVIPNEGYVVDTIKVTDSKGNVVELSDNTFVMPNYDVIVDVTFKKEVINPNTVSIGIISFVIIALIGGFIFVKINKKLSWLK